MTKGERMSEKQTRKYLIDDPGFTRNLIEGFFANIPHSQEIGTTLVSAERNKAVLRVPFKENLVGNAATGVIHGGVILSLMDAAGGMATFCALPRMEPIATLDLRVDYLKPAIAGMGIEAAAECYKLTNTIAFIRAIAYQNDSSDPVASCVATFMRGSSNKIQGMH